MIATQTRRALIFSLRMEHFPANVNLALLEMERAVQTSTNVPRALILAMPMLRAPITMGTTLVYANQDSVEMDPTVRISMNVSTQPTTTATYPMANATTTSARTHVHAMLATQEMASIAPISMNARMPHSMTAINMQAVRTPTVVTPALAIKDTLGMELIVQTSMSALSTHTIVTPTQPAMTLKAHSPARVTLASLGVELLAQISTNVSMKRFATEMPHATTYLERIHVFAILQWLVMVKSDVERFRSTLDQQPKMELEYTRKQSNL